MERSWAIWSGGTKGGYEAVDAEGPGGFSEDGDATGVAAEGGDVALDPGQGEALVEVAEVAGCEGEVW